MLKYTKIISIIDKATAQLLFLKYIAMDIAIKFITAKKNKAI